ncbi:hypothetical protein EVAR_4734_1 [Eumeta japonica]|uniref:Uncharacterized protein n=1 Tax=Eumeta variegata TaxID=151549 RepID=A0A4C1SZN4_EUMVA|nr:hypothetical protein EVAR_4734_1 [Eumeta japonica]
MHRVDLVIIASFAQGSRPRVSKLVFTHYKTARSGKGAPLIEMLSRQFRRGPAGHSTSARLGPAPGASPVACGERRAARVSADYPVIILEEITDENGLADGPPTARV